MGVALASTTTLTLLCSCSRSRSRSGSPKPNGVVRFSFSTLNYPIVSKFNNQNAELQVQTRMWNWKGYSIRYQFSGNDGPPLLLVHGFGANSDHWRNNIPVLAKSHRVYSIDLIGYGYSDKPNPRQFGDQSFYTFETWASQLNDFCLHVIQDQPFFICNSIGGASFKSSS